MKKILIGLTVIGGFSFMSAQINQAVDATQDSRQSFFYDAGTFGDVGAYGQRSKGMVFPRTDLTQFEFITAGAFTKGSYYSCYDGMVVYNTKGGIVNEKGTESDTKGKKVNVEPGFYYFSNPGIDSESGQCSISGGQWVRIGRTELSSGVENGKFWTLKGNSGTDATVDYLGTTDAQNLVMKVNVDKEGLEGLEGADDYNPTKLILGNAVDAPAFTKVVIGGTPDEQKTALEKRIKKVQPAGQADATDFKFVLEVFGKARFSEGIVTKSSTYPDYVFDNYFTGKSDVNPDYKFKKLNEVEAFIKENNHLPGVTKIDDLAKTESGYEVDNTQLSIQTLEKVEELYLHLIEQQKEIQALKAQIAELKK